MGKKVDGPDLFGESPPFQAHSETSKAAAEQAKPTASTLRELLYRYLAGCPKGLTDEEMQIELDMVGSTQRPRRVELVKEGRVKDSGRTRKTRSGRNAVVWLAVVKEKDDALSGDQVPPA